MYVYSIAKYGKMQEKSHRSGIVYLNGLSLTSNIFIRLGILPATSIEVHSFVSIGVLSMENIIPPCSGCHHS
jgi:hypothetical protein